MTMLATLFVAISTTSIPVGYACQDVTIVVPGNIVQPQGFISTASLCVPVQR